MFIYISVIAILIIISILLVSEVILLKNKLKNLQHLYDKAESSKDFWRNVAKNYRHSLLTLSNARVMSVKDIKSLVVMIPPVRQHEGCMQRVAEEFIKFKNRIQGSNP